jgi:Heterokaryon incompatibility protein (HET)/Ankyrin repeats (3 copies)
MWPWSDEVKSQYGLNTTWPISLNNKFFYVGQNLYDALKEMPRHHWAHLRGEKGKTVLHRAAERGDSMTTWSAITHGARPNCKDQSAKSPLHYAAQSGNLEIVEMLVNAGAELDAVDSEQKLPSACAQEHGHSEVFRYLTRLEKLQERPKVSFGPSDDATPTHIWIDAICIDQSNDEERGHQVRLMRKIYEAANCVSIWLGTADKLTAHAVEAVALIAAHNEKFAASEIVPYFENKPHIYETAGIPPISPLQWNALASLYLRKWFSRAWIMQETVLAREVLVWCGAHEIIFDNLCVVTEALSHRYDIQGFPSSAGYGHRMLPVPPGPTSSPHQATSECLRSVAGAIEGHFNAVVETKIVWILHGLPPQSQVQHASWKGKESLTLVSLLFKAWTFECKDPRDKIYSLLGLAVSDPDEHGIQPDYTKSAVELYVQVTRYILKKGKGLGVLDNISDSAKEKRLPNLPTWVLDFSATGVSGMFGSRFDAAGTRRKDGLLPPLADWRRLAVTGKKLGSVAEIGNSFEGGSAHFSFDPTWYAMISNLDSTYVTGEDRADILWRTLCLNQALQEDVLAPVEFKDQFRQFICAVVCAEGEKERVKKSATTKLAYTLLGPIFRLQGLPTEDAERAAGFARALHGTGNSLDPSIHGPHFDSMREALLILNELAKGDPNCALPTLDQVEDFRRNSKWQLHDGEGRLKPNLDLRMDHRFMVAVGTRYHRRRLFRTKENLLGLGPRSLRVGDELWILGGTIFPFILRPLPSGAYNLVGTSYVHGIMHGEAVTPDVVFEKIELE